jgi:hypothetical protein
MIATAAALAPSALAVTPPATVTSVFQTTPISIGVSDAVGYAIANTSGTTQTVTFTDTLPSGVALDNPIGTTNTTGSATCTNLSVTNPSTGQGSNPGDGAVTISATVPSVSGSSSSKPVCTISLSVVASTPSNDIGLKDTFSSLSPAGVVATPSTTGLTVLSNPSLSFTAPTSGQSFTLGQISDAAFACITNDPKDSIDAFFGTDDEGNQIQSGAPIDTVDPGTHSLEVDCYSAAGGGEVTQTINYTVGSYTLSAVKAAKATRFVSFRTTVPAGKLVAKAFYGKKVIGTTTVSRSSRGSVGVTVKPTNAGKKLLAALKGSSANLKLQVSFTAQAIGTGTQQIAPAGATVVSKTVKLPLAHTAKKKAAKAAKSNKSAKRK